VSLQREYALLGKVIWLTYALTLNKKGYNMDKTVKPTKPDVKLKLIKGTAAIDKAIQSIARRGRTLESDIHLTAVSCLMHTDVHGDVTLADKLIDSIPTLARKNALRDWFLAMGKFRYDEETKKFKHNKNKVTLEQEAMNKPFWEFKAESPYVPFDIDAALQNLLKRATKAIKDGDKVDEAKINALKSLVVTQPDF
jgi:hypothetical protein